MTDCNLEGVKKTAGELIVQSRQFVADCRASGFAAAAGIAQPENTTVTSCGEVLHVCLIAAGISHQVIGVATAKSNRK